MNLSLLLVTDMKKTFILPFAVMLFASCKNEEERASEIPEAALEIWMIFNWTKGNHGR